MLPPHDSPTSWARAVDAWNRSRLAPWRPSRQSSAAWMTLPSTQPPDTDPAMPPRSLTAITDPGTRGDEPQVFVTWASATSLPVSNQRATSSLISRMVLSPWNRIGAARPRAARGTGAAARSYAVWQVAHSSFDRFWPAWLEGCCAPVLEPLWQLRQSEPLLPCPMAGGSPTMP